MDVLSCWLFFIPVEQGNGLPLGLSASMDVRRVIHVARQELASTGDSSGTCKWMEPPEDQNQRGGNFQRI